MKIYEFSTWGILGKNKLFNIAEREVEEKPKTYIGKGIRINKSDIDIVQSGYGNRMFSLSNNPDKYIEQMIKIQENRIKRQEESLVLAKENLNKWKEIKLY